MNTLSTSWKPPQTTGYVVGVLMGNKTGGLWTDASGTAGGILVCWDKKVAGLLDWEEGQFTISCWFRKVEDGAVWVFTGVYGPFTKNERDCMWDEIGAIRAMRKFAQVIDELGLIDLLLQGGDYTWSGGPNNRYWARLDRFLVTPSWMDQFSSVIQKRLPRPASDHFPVVLEGGTVRRGPSPFRFENMWLKVDGFQELIHSWWQGIEVRGSASFRLDTKLKVVKQKLKEWNREVFGRLEDNKAAALQLVDHWDRVESFQRVMAEGRGQQYRILPSYGGCTSLEGRHRRAAVRATKSARGRELGTTFSEEEILSALMEMNGDKAPGPDDFTMAFWQRCWVIVKEEVLEMFKEFYEQSAFIKSMNSTFLVLIPKKGGGLRTLGNSGQSVSWGAVQTIGQVSDESHEKDGVRFKVAGMDVELYLHSQIFGVGEWSVAGFFPRSEEEEGSQCMFPTCSLADDTIVFCEARKEYLTYLSWILFWFEAASGLRINLEKSELIPVGEVEEMEEMAAELGCKVGSMPSVYLGLPLGARNKSAAVWDGVEEKMRRRLAHWKRQYISKGGRLILIKSTMTSIPLYQMSLFRMPKLVARRLEKLQRDFLWGGGNLERKVHIVNWKIVLLSQRFSHLYGMAAHRNGTVEDMWDQNVGQGDWDVRFVRGFNDWELDLVGNLLHTLRGFNPTLEEDAVFWKWGKNGKFKVKEAYNLVLLGARCSRLIGSREEGGISLIGASCVDVKRKL
ncbi:hypothetical protein CK203_103918 [Vitis vinifera]|uniref:Uncharacterized protein n=1 Tax=Vitis vinifera TaxID=29760 RepID=A0A438CTT5_VITVI|nr:hypothetical protein CK203_103918 [Vitis vinifera]